MTYGQYPSRNGARSWIEVNGMCGSRIVAMVGSVHYVFSYLWFFKNKKLSIVVIITLKDLLFKKEQLLKNVINMS